MKDLTLACGSGPLLGATEEMKALVANGQIKKLIDSYGPLPLGHQGQERSLRQQLREGQIELEVYPMGTLAEMYRAAGAGNTGLFPPVGGGSAWRRWS